MHTPHKAHHSAARFSLLEQRHRCSPAHPTAPKASEEPTYYVCHEGVIGVGLRHQQLNGGQQRGDVQGGPPRTLQEERGEKQLRGKPWGCLEETQGSEPHGLLSARRLRPLWGS